VLNNLNAALGRGAFANFHIKRDATPAALKVLSERGQCLNQETVSAAFAPDWASPGSAKVTGRCQ